jgi:hypothetical protein
VKHRIKSIEQRAREGGKEIRDLLEFAETQAREKGTAYTENHRRRDTELVLCGVIRRAVEADRRNRGGR